MEEESATEVTATRCNTFLNVLNGPSLDLKDFTTETRELVREYHNLEPKSIMEFLVQRATSTNTSAEKFLEDINNLILTRFHAESLEVVPEDLGSIIKQLEEKYKIRESCNEPDTISFSRLCFTFPHYAVRHKQNFLVSYNGYDLDPHVKQFFLPEFGGLLPSKTSKLNKDVRETIIIIHLYCLQNQKKLIPSHNKPEIGVYTNLVLLKRRVESGLLTDERRLRFLMLQNVIAINGELTQQTKRAFKSISDNHSKFVQDIIKMWSLVE